MQCQINTNEKSNSTKKKARSEAIPVQTWTGPEGSSKSRLADFKTTGALSW
jgi:hypothetical protein